LQVFDPAGASAVTIGGNSVSGGYTAMRLGSSAASGEHSEIQSVQSSGSACGALALNPAGGNVGIGSYNPTTKLEVTGNNGDGAIITARASAGDAYLVLDAAPLLFPQVGPVLSLRKNNLTRWQCGPTVLPK
jgi:hypothetical protein